MTLKPHNPPADARWAFTREGLESLLHHAHPIPLGRGFTSTHMSKNWPGLPFSDAIAIAKRAGAFVRDREHFSGLRVAAQVDEFHILHDGTGRVTPITGPNRTGKADKAPAKEDRENLSGFLIESDRLLDMTVDELREFLRAAFQRPPRTEN